MEKLETPKQNLTFHQKVRFCLGFSIFSWENNWKNYKNIIKEISIEAENKKKEIHFYFSSSENILELKIRILNFYMYLLMKYMVH